MLQVDANWLREHVRVAAQWVVLLGRSSRLLVILIDVVISCEGDRAASHVGLPSPSAPHLPRRAVPNRVLLAADCVGSSRTTVSQTRGRPAHITLAVRLHTWSSRLEFKFIYCAFSLI